jgi:menaquinone-dependent protoporphyrinogen oxidase
MPRILVFFGTTDGHTAKVAHVLGDDLRDAGATVHIVDAGTGHSDPRPEDYDAVIVAASVHLGNFQRSIAQWVQRHHRALTGMPSAFLPVSLTALQADAESERELLAIVEKFYATTGWRPATSKSLAGALLFTRYGWLTRWLMQRSARKAGLKTDTSKDYEYTDWNELRVFAQSFVRRVERTRRAPVFH